jgi:hypothetical protein
MALPSSLVLWIWISSMLNCRIQRAKHGHRSKISQDNHYSLRRRGALCVRYALFPSHSVRGPWGHHFQLYALTSADCRLRIMLLTYFFVYVFLAPNVSKMRKTKIKSIKIFGRNQKLLCALSWNHCQYDAERKPIRRR